MKTVMIINNQLLLLQIMDIDKTYCVFTVDDLESEIVCETYVLGAKDLNTSSSTTTTTTTTTIIVAVDYPQLIISEISSSIPEYDRDDWNHWIDENGDCQNTRHEVLIEESFETVTYTSDTYCSVSTGKWYGNYSVLLQCL